MFYVVLDYPNIPPSDRSLVTMVTTQKYTLLNKGKYFEIGQSWQIIAEYT